MSCSPTLHTAQSRGLDQTLAKANTALSELANVLARGNTRRSRDQVTTEIKQIIKDPWTRRVINWELTGDTPPEHRLTFHIDDQARTDLETEIFGKRVLITDRENWPIAEVVAGYRSQSEAEFSFRQLKDPHVVSFSPMHHWTDHNIRVHLFTCVLALQIAHLMRHHAHQHGLHLSVHELLDTLAGIQETVLAGRGIVVDHVTVYRWGQRFTPLLIDAARPCRHTPGDPMVRGRNVCQGCP